MEAWQSCMKAWIMRQVKVIEGTRLPPGAKEALELKEDLDLFYAY